MTSSKINFSPKGLFIGGKWVDSFKEGRFSTINPSNGQHLGEVPLAEKDLNELKLIEMSKIFHRIHEERFGYFPLITSLLSSTSS